MAVGPNDPPNRCRGRRWARLVRTVGSGVVVLWMLTQGVSAADPVAAAPTASRPGGSAVASAWDGLLATHCGDCHGAGAAEAGLNLATLSRDLRDEATFAVWERIFDRVDRGEMPPEGEGDLSDADRVAITGTLGRSLTAAHAARRGTVLRRLNRREYQNTLNDLFGTDLDLASLLPEDSRSHEFDNVGSALGLSMVQMQKYLEATTTVLDAAIQASPAPPERKARTFTFAETRDGKQFFGKQWLLRPDGAVVFFQDWGYPDGMLREASAEREGWYDVTVTGYAYQSDKPITFALEGKTYDRGAEQPVYEYLSLPPGEPTSVTVRAYVKKNYMMTVTPQGIADSDYLIKKNGLDAYRGPGLAIKSLTLDGPIVDEFPSRGHKLIFDGLDRRPLPPKDWERGRSWYVPKHEVVSSDPAGDATDVLVRVATAAFRRPVAEADVAAYRDLFLAETADGQEFEAALRTAVTAIFCSPRFLFLREGEGYLDDHALASRLAYFLTRSAPDEALRTAAEAGTLTKDRTALLAQAERLLATPGHGRFVEDFTDAWLNLREIELTNPDGQLYPEFDLYLQHSAVDETRATVADLIAADRNVTEIVRSGHAMLNERLAEHYGIAGVEGPRVRRVDLPAGSLRGGLLTQASVLKVSANGTNTSPVVRGVYVMERILGQAPPPPPPGIPGVEPDIRGATTLRELLDKHRDSVSCQACHRMIDPPGFALECFDPIGTYRERFRSLGEGEKVAAVVHGKKVQYRLGPPVAVGGVEYRCLRLPLRPAVSPRR